MNGRPVILQNSEGIKMSMTTMCRTLWKGVTGQQWIDHNPTTAKAHNELWSRDYGISKSDAIKNIVRGMIPEDASWLEIGSSMGAHLGCVRVCGWSDLSGIDLCYESVEDASDPYSRFVADGQNIPFADNSFDVVTSSGTLMLVGGPETGLSKVVSEMARVSRRYILVFEPYFTKFQLNLHSIEDRPFPPTMVIPWEKYFSATLPEWEIASAALFPSKKETPDENIHWFPMCGILLENASKP